MAFKTLTETECLMDILHSAKACQAILAVPFENRGRIQDRAIYWAIARVAFSLEALISLIEASVNS